MLHLPPALRFTFCALSVLLPACSRSGSELRAAETLASSPHERPSPSDDRLAERSRQRWERVCAGDWVLAYDFLTPEQKQAVPLDRFLAGKSVHRYANARVIEA